MKTFELKEGKYSETISVPENWNELTSAQMLYIGEYWEAWKALLLNDMSLIKAKSLLVIELFSDNTPRNKKRRVDLLAKAKSHQLYQLTELTNFIFETKSLTKCPVPIIEFDQVKLFPPADALGNINGFEFTFADSFYLQYDSSGDISKLEFLISILYRELEPSGKRKMFDNELADKFIQQIKKLPYATKQAILLWYIGCRDRWEKDNPEIFTGGNESSAKNNGWLPVILMLAGDKFGTFDQTGNTEMSLIFMEIKRLREYNKKVKK